MAPYTDMSILKQFKAPNLRIRNISNSTNQKKSISVQRGRRIDVDGFPIRWGYPHGICRSALYCRKIFPISHTLYLTIQQINTQ